MKKYHYEIRNNHNNPLWISSRTGEDYTWDNIGNPPRPAYFDNKVEADRVAKDFGGITVKVWDELPEGEMI